MRTAHPYPPVMRSRFPEGRVGTLRFCEIAGLSRTTFLMRYRPEPAWIRAFDIRVDALNRLNMSEEAARRFAEDRAGRRAHGNAGRFAGRPCPACARVVANAAKVCRGCGQTLR